MKKDKGNREEAILKAATKVFFNKGYRATKMSDIAREANLSKGLSYFYFKNKDELYFAVMNSAMTNAINFAEAFFNQNSSSIENMELKSMVSGFMDFFNANPEMTKAIINTLGLKQKFEKSQDRPYDPSAFESKYYKELQLTMARSIEVIKNIIDGLRKDDPKKTGIASQEIFWIGLTVLVGHRIISKTLHRVESDPSFKEFGDLFIGSDRFDELILNITDIIVEYINQR